MSGREGFEFEPAKIVADNFDHARFTTLSAGGADGKPMGFTVAVVLFLAQWICRAPAGARDLDGAEIEDCFADQGFHQAPTPN